MDSILLTLLEAYASMVAYASRRVDSIDSIPVWQGFVHPGWLLGAGYQVSASTRKLFWRATLTPAPVPTSNVERASSLSGLPAHSEHLVTTPCSACSDIRLFCDLPAKDLCSLGELSHVEGR
jgi:hypothetical protein